MNLPPRASLAFTVLLCTALAGCAKSDADYEKELRTTQVAKCTKTTSAGNTIPQDTAEKVCTCVISRLIEKEGVAAIREAEKKGSDDAFNQMAKPHIEQCVMEHMKG